MCGIVGFITTEDKKGENDRAKFFKQALIIDTLRGDDSTGAFAVGHKPFFDDHTPYWFKQVGGGEAFTDTKEYWENFADVSPFRAMVGHNRAATVGSVSAGTAHPFQEGPITLVHNGTLTTTHGLPNPMAGLDDCEVDSHAICHNLALHSVQDVVEKLNGAFALVWHDARDNSVNIVRNTRRPLHFGLNKAGDTLYFMSEGEMLAMLDARIKLNIGNIYYPSEGQYLKWLPDTPLDRPITEELDLYEDHWNSYSYNHGKYNSYADRYGSAYSWEDEDDDDPLGHCYPKATAHNEKDDWILVGGRRKEVPMILQEKMMEFDVVTEDRWEFTPDSFGMNPQDTDRMHVAGEVHGLGRGIIYTISPTTVGTTGTGKATWTVRIIGMKIDTNGEPWYICRLVSTFVNPAVISNHVVRTTREDDDAPGWDDDIPYHTEDETEAMRKSLAYDMVPGPGGILVTEHDFAREVADGCVMCTKPISIRDAYDLIWVGEGAICPTCDDRLYVSPELGG